MEVMNRRQREIIGRLVHRAGGSDRLRAIMRSAYIKNNSQPPKLSVIVKMIDDANARELQRVATRGESSKRIAD